MYWTFLQNKNSYTYGRKKSCKQFENRVYMGIFGPNFRVWTSKKHRIILYKNNEKSFVFLIKWRGEKFRLKQKNYLRVFFNWTSLIWKKLSRYSSTRNSDISDIREGGGQNFVFSGDVICERPLVEIFIKNMTHKWPSRS